MDHPADAHPTQTDRTESADLKPWQAPKCVILDVDETASDFIAVTDSTSFFS